MYHHHFYFTFAVFLIHIVSGRNFFEMLGCLIVVPLWPDVCLFVQRICEAKVVELLNSMKNNTSHGAQTDSDIAGESYGQTVIDTAKKLPFYAAQKHIARNISDFDQACRHSSRRINRDTNVRITVNHIFATSREAFVFDQEKQTFTTVENVKFWKCVRQQGDDFKVVEIGTMKPVFVGIGQTCHLDIKQSEETKMLTFTV